MARGVVPTARLPRAQVRIARRTAARLREGGLVVVVGTGEQRRREFEAALAHEGVTVASAVLDLDADPWEQIIALANGGATACVTWSEAQATDGFWGALNLGREQSGALSAGLLMWIGGLDSIGRFAMGAPDLWSHRAGVEWVISAADFRAEPIPWTAAAHMAMDAIGDELKKYEIGDPRTISWLKAYAEKIIGLGDTVLVLEALERAEHAWSSVTRPQQWLHVNEDLLGLRLMVSVHVGRGSDVLAELDAAAYEPGFLGAGVHGFRVLLARARYDRAAALLDAIASDSAVDVRLSYSALVYGVLGQMEVAGSSMVNLSGYGRAEAECLCARAQLRPMDSVRSALRAVQNHEWEPTPMMALVPGIVDDLCRLGLAVDAYGVLDGLFGATVLHMLHDVELCRCRARVLVETGACALGFAQYWTAFEKCRSLILSCLPMRAMAATAALDLLLDPLIPMATTEAEAAKLRALGVEIAGAATEAALQQRQFDLAQVLRSQSARLMSELQRYDQARALLEQNLAWSLDNEGPSRVCQRHLELARLEVERGELGQALAAVDLAHRAIMQAPAEYQPLAVWRELLLDHAEVLAAAGQPRRARTLQIEARERMAKAGLRADELLALHALAEPLRGEGPEALDLRERAAADALALVAPTGLIYEEARALANFALVHAERGRRAPAETMLAEARWLTDDLVYGPIREHIERATAAVAAALT